MSGASSLSGDYFDAVYANADDPWSFATSAYEAEKYDRSLAVLAPHYARAFEIGCSIGVFTRRLAERCEDLLAIDISERALTLARERCADAPQVWLARMEFPRESPRDQFDLITCSEVAYYWSDEDLAAARDRIAELLIPGGDLLLVHWLPRVEDYLRDGDAVHAFFLADERFIRVAQHRAERYRLDLLRRNDVGTTAR
jgi:SAM-dependent methyltransferase